VLVWKFKDNIAKILIVLFTTLLILGTMGGGYVLAQKPEVELHLAITAPPTKPSGQHIIAFIKAVRDESKGRIKIIPHFYGELSKSERDYVDLLMSGDLDLAHIATSGMASYTKTLQLFDLPFLYENDEKKAAFMTSDAAQDIIDKVYQELGIRPLRLKNNPTAGARWIVSSKPIRTSEDMKGLKIRTMESQLLVKIFRALGANPLPLPYGECYTALQMKLVDAMENSLSSILSHGFSDYAKYVVDLTPVDVVTPIWISGKTWEKLSPENQKILLKAADISAEAVWACFKYDFINTTKQLKEDGVEIIYLPDEEKAKAREAVEEAMKDDFNEAKNYYYDLLGYDVFNVIENPEKYGGRMFDFQHYTPETWVPLPWPLPEVE